MHTTPSIRRLTAAALAASAALVMTGCVLPLPAQPTTPTSAAPQPTESTPASPSGEPAEPSESAAPAEGIYSLQNDPSASVVWSFEPVDAQRVETDALGAAADPGQQLVILHMDGQLLSGTPDFYYQFTVQGYDPATEQTIGLSSASQFYAEDDLFTVGREPEFQQADAIFQLLEGWDISNWRIICNETGEEWIVQVPVV